MMVAIVFLSFFMLSAAFMMLSYRYIIAEKRDAMERNADYIASFTSEYIQQSGSLDVYFRSYVATLASVSDSNVLLSDVDGDIILCLRRQLLRPVQLHRQPHPPAGSSSRCCPAVPTTA